MQCRERELHLRLDAGDLHELTARRLTRAVAQQRGLAYARLTSKDQHGTFAATDRIQRAIQGLTLADTSKEGRRPRNGHTATLRPTIGHGNIVRRPTC